MNSILKSITPSSKEKAQSLKIAQDIIQKINSALPQVKAHLGGSAAKDTNLSNNHDLDIFVTFPSSSSNKDLSAILEKTLKKLKIPFERLHGSRDYFQLQYQNYTVELVPIITIAKASEAQNITDVSLLHVSWVNKHTKSLKNDIRLAKAFMKANRLYGAESYISGLSGYVIEILITHYGSFTNLLTHLTKIKSATVIDIENHYPKKDALFRLNKSKTTSPLIIIDPTDKSRNASAALSTEKFIKLKKVAKQYLKDPQPTSFIYELITKEYAKSEFKKGIYLQLDLGKGKHDVLGAKAVKICEHLKRHLTLFDPKDSLLEFNTHATLALQTKKSEIPKQIELKGPPLKLTDAVTNFQKKHPNTFNKNNHIYATKTITKRNLLEATKAALEHKYVTEKITRVINVTIF